MPPAAPRTYSSTDRIWGGNWLTSGANAELDRVAQNYLGRGLSEEELNEAYGLAGHAPAIDYVKGLATPTTTTQPAPPKEEPTEKAAPAPTSSAPMPVTDTGQIAPPTAAAPIASPGAGWVQIPGGGWVPGDHPLAQTASKESSTSSTSTTTPVNPQMPFPVNQGADLLKQILANPYSMDQSVVNKMVEQQKETALQRHGDTLQNAISSAAARGTLGGGAMQSYERRANDALTSALLEGQRDIAIQQATQNNADRQAAYGSALSTYGADVGAWQAAQNAMQSQQELALQKLLGEGGLAVDREKISAAINQANQANQLGWGQLMGQLAMSQDANAFDWGSLYSGAMQDFWKQLLG